MTPQQAQTIDDYFASILSRFWNMNQSGVDTIGIKKATEMVEGYLKTKTITPGEFKYIYDRTHPLGELPKYNKTGKKWGLMDECPVDILVEYVVNWQIPHQSFKMKLAKNHPQFPDWYASSNNLNRPKLSPIYSELFKEG
jgi:hypothetical protein